MLNQLLGRKACVRQRVVVRRLPQAVQWFLLRQGVQLVEIAVYLAAYVDTRHYRLKAAAPFVGPRVAAERQRDAPSAFGVHDSVVAGICLQPVFYAQVAADVPHLSVGAHAAEHVHAGVEGVRPAAETLQAAADDAVLLQHGDAVALLCQQGPDHQSAQSSAHDADSLHCRPPFRGLVRHTSRPLYRYW